MAFQWRAFDFPVITRPSPSQLARLGLIVDDIIELDATLDELLQNPPPYLPPPGAPESPIIIEEESADASQSPIVTEDEPTSPSEIKAILKERKKYLNLRTRHSDNINRWWGSFLHAPPKEQEAYCRDNWAYLTNKETLTDVEWAASVYFDFTEARLTRLDYKAASEKDGVSEEELAEMVKEDSEELKKVLPKRRLMERGVQIEFEREHRKEYRTNRKMKRDRRNGIVERSSDEGEKAEAEISPATKRRKKQPMEEPITSIEPSSAIETPFNEQEMVEDGPDVDDLERLLREAFEKDKPVSSHDDDEEELDEGGDLSGPLSEEAEDNTPGTSVDEEEKEGFANLKHCEELTKEPAPAEITSEVEEVEDGDDLRELFEEDSDEEDNTQEAEFQEFVDFRMDLKLVWSESLKCWEAGSE
jgi:hypothetical protein